MSAEEQSLLGVEIGGTKLQVVLGTASGRIVRRWRASASRTGGGAEICKQIAQAVRDITSDTPISAIGAGFGGPVNWRTGQICKSHQIEGWEGFQLSAFLNEAAGAPAYIDNDANVAALGEAIMGAGRGSDPVFYVTLGSGVGGGLVVGGLIYHGMPPGEAEFGHTKLERTGETVESRCSGWAIDRTIRCAALVEPQGIFAQLIGTETGGEARHLRAALLRDDVKAKEILAQLGDDLAFALSHVVHLLHPSTLILGGGLSLIGEPLRAAVTERLAKHIMAAFAPGPEVKLAHFGEDAVLVGALILAAQDHSN